ncbi:MAG: YggS family pyridoxal phosphate-dependent enzyme [Acidimicrobiaceae bacterium]|jgi:pyridoxal phosphate enzyme (YggS family)|nr:YggS family pyridoxal phosphate-dependent enzyme [Acidimicrobiaceae bacterium]|tara:strand:- start:4923 stop:5576 length:654 start_codon:yes stop_codon:yes gene_type:complete
MTSENDLNHLEERLVRINALIKMKAQNPVKLVAVTKGFTHEELSLASDLGIRDFGENYAQEILTKDALTKTDISWHFIGQIQSNKIRKVSHLVDTWHSVTSMKIAREINKRNKCAELLLQVSVKGPSNSKGFTVEELPNALSELRRENIDVAGLMTMGVPGDREATRDSFNKLRELANTFELAECSMGMSGDFEIALESGSTMLRIGSAIFGNRRTD